MITESPVTVIAGFFAAVGLGSGCVHATAVTAQSRVDAPQLSCSASPHQGHLPSQPLYSIARCDQSAHDRAAEELEQLRRMQAQRLRGVVIYVSDVQGSRPWAGVSESVEGARLLMSLCFRHWVPRDSSQKVVLSLSIASDGTVRVARPDRDDGLGTCIAEVARTLEFPPDGFSSQSSEVLASISFSPALVPIVYVEAPAAP